MAPVVRFETTPSVLVETEGTVLTFTFQLSEAPPSSGVNVTVEEVNISQRQGDSSAFLNHLDLNFGTNVTVTGGDRPIPNNAFTGLDFNIRSQTATISIPTFNEENDPDPDPGFDGERNFVFVLRPGQGYTVDPSASQDSVILRDEPAPNRPPVANDDSGSIPENQVFNGNVSSNDSDPDGDTITISALNGNAGGIGTGITLNSGAILTLNANGSYAYNPNGRFDYLNDGQTTGDTFTYTLSDGRGGTDTASVFITITGVTQTPTNQNPVAVNDTGSTSEKQAFSGNVLSNDGDPDGDSLVISAVNGTPNIGIPINLASGAILILNADGSYNYNPNGQFNYLNDGQTATDSFNYNISDGRGGAAATTVTIAIGGITDAPPGFDPAQYGASYPDLIQAIGFNLPALTNHYITAGQAEGRSPDLFDEFRYTASNRDLASIYGLNGAGATEHYIRYGLAEGRSTTAFIPSRYLLSYDDLLGVFGTNTLAGTQHYITNGIVENRNPNLFPSDRYIASHRDLISAFNYNLEAGSNHYLFAGRNEGRQITFDPARYLASYQDDLLGAFGTNTVAATQHFITNGFSEGRNPNLFPSDRYIASYGDLIQAFDYNLEAGSNHYLYSGRGEGRQVSFDPQAYLNRYGDLQQAFGGDLTAATRHYIVNGFDEGRTWM